MRLPARFSLATLLGLTTLVAGGFAVWRAYIWEPATHKIALYERAPGTKGRSIEVGPNHVSLHLLARNARDGTIHNDAQRSSAGKLSSADAQTLKNAASWLDIVQLELGPGPNQIDIIEARIFEHVSREMLSDIDRSYGWRVIRSNAIQIYGLGKSLPSRVDVWFRAHSHAPQDIVTTLTPTPGSSCAMGEGSITLADIREGSWNFDGKQFTVSTGDRPFRISTVVELRGRTSESRFQIAAVTKSGIRVHSDIPHFFTHYPGPPRVMPISWHMPLDELSHFEIRPFGGRSTFFFEAVALPPVPQQAFAPPPVAKVAVQGRETAAALAEFKPFDIRIALRDGHWAGGVAAHSTWAAVMAADKVTELGTGFTLDYAGVGIGKLGMRLRFTSEITGKPIAEQELGRRSNSTSYGATSGAGYNEYRYPLKNVGAVEVTLQK